MLRTLKPYAVRIAAQWKRHKDAVSLLSSAIALIVSGVAYFATVWRGHELRVFVRTSVVDGEKYPVQVLLSNTGQHTEVVLAAEINAGKCNASEMYRLRHAGAPPVLVIEKSSYAIAAISIDGTALLQDANAVYKEKPNGIPEFAIKPMLILEYLAPDGRPQIFCTPIGEFKFADGSDMFAGITVDGTTKSIKVYRSAAAP